MLFWDSLRKCCKALLGQCISGTNLGYGARYQINILSHGATAARNPKREEAILQLLVTWYWLNPFAEKHDQTKTIPIGHCHWLVEGARNGPLTRYVKLRVAHAPEMSGTFSLPPRVSDPDMRHGTCVSRRCTINYRVLHDHRYWGSEVGSTGAVLWPS